MRIELLGFKFTDAIGMEVHHNPWMVAMAFAVAVIASHTAIGMSERCQLADPRRAGFWLAGAALALGGGIWSMHFIAMLALDAGMAVSYDPYMTLLSFSVAVGAAGCAMGISVERRFSWYRLGASGLVLGSGVAAMHYLAMAAMRAQATIAYTPGLFFASILIAVAAAAIATHLATKIRQPHHRLFVAVLMAAGISGMHFAGMAATVIQLHPMASEVGGANQGVLAIAVAGASLGVLLLGMVSIAADRRLTAAAEHEAAVLREANQALRHAAARAEAANKAKTDFLGVVAHEFRTPLNGIIGFSDLIAAHAKLDDEQRQWCELLRSSGHTLSHLVNDLIEYARLDHEDIQLASEPFSLGSALARAIAIARLQADEKGIHLKCEVAPDAGDRVIGDERRVLQIIGNLLSNAIKFTDQGEVGVQMCTEADGSVVISVVDTGPGIAEADLEAIFDRFRTGNAHDARRGGLGLGLAIARRLARAMGGDISCARKPGSGAVFTVRLPLRIPGNGAERGGETLRALVVDDVATNRRLIKACLSQRGHVVDEAASGDDAIDLARRHRYDVILMDLRMPGLNGWQTACRIHELPGSGDVPIIAVSADLAGGGVDAGGQFVGFIPKPLDVRNFAGQVDRLRKFPARPGIGGGGQAGSLERKPAVNDGAAALPVSVATSLRECGGGNRATANLQGRP